MQSITVLWFSVKRSQTCSNYIKLHANSLDLPDWGGGGGSTRTRSRFKKIFPNLYMQICSSAEQRRVRCRGLLLASHPTTTASGWPAGHATAPFTATVWVITHVHMHSSGAGVLFRQAQGRIMQVRLSSTGIYGSLWKSQSYKLLYCMDAYIDCKIGLVVDHF